MNLVDDYHSLMLQIYKNDKFYKLYVSNMCLLNTFTRRIAHYCVVKDITLLITLHCPCSNRETFIRDFPVILKRMLQNDWKITRRGITRRGITRRGITQRGRIFIRWKELLSCTVFSLIKRPHRIIYKSWRHGDNEWKIYTSYRYGWHNIVYLNISTRYKYYFAFVFVERCYFSKIVIELVISLDFSSSRKSESNSYLINN